MSKAEVQGAPAAVQAQAKVAQAYLVVSLSELSGRYGGVLMRTAKMQQPELHAALCKQRDELEALIARL